jgi:surface carbohydrate biosynthesis protein
MRIAIALDSKWRDSFANALLKHELLKQLPDAEIYPISFDICQDAIRLIKPHVLIINHVLGKRNEDLANYVKRQGGLVVVAPPEGRTNTSEQLDWFVQQSRNPDLDLFLSWNSEMASRIPQAVVTGCPRFDIHQSPYNQLINTRERFCERYNINPTKRIISFMSSFPQSKFAWRNQSFAISDWRDLKVTSIPGREDPLNVARREYKALNSFRLWIRYLINKYGDEFEYVLKPHPLEEQSEWDKFASDTGVHLIKADYVFHVISASDLIIARGDCVTHCDSWLMNKPTIHALLGDVGRSGAGREALQYGLGSAYTAEELGRLVHLWLHPPKRKPRINDHNEYLSRYGFNVERSGEKCATQIVNLINDRQPQVSDISLGDRVGLNQLLQQHDINTFTNQIDYAGHYGKSSSRHTTNEWIQQIKQVEAK